MCAWDGSGLFAPSSLWQVEALTGAVIDRPRSGILLHALTLMGNERYGSLCVCVCVCDGRAGEGGVRSPSIAIKFGAVHSRLIRDWPRGLPIPSFI